MAKSVFKSRTEVVEYRFFNPDDADGSKGLEPETWPEDSVMYFAKYRTGADDDLITRKTAKTLMKFDRRRARREGRDYNPDWEQEVLMSGAMALITVMSRGWKGSIFRLDEDYTLPDGRRHPYAGKEVPCSREYIEQLDPLILADIERKLQALYEPESEEDRATFQDNRVVAPRPSRLPGTARPDTRSAEGREEVLPAAALPAGGASALPVHSPTHNG